MKSFDEKLKDLQARHEALLARKNEPESEGNGVFTRYISDNHRGAHALVLALRP